VKEFWKLASIWQS